ncbi:hypothetical protein IW261DRAFT_1434133, partial [Armillaria novae-zelandiae]
PFSSRPSTSRASCISSSVSLSLLFAASTLAYEIVEPSGNNGWIKSGSNTVNTDPMTVTVILTNEASSTFRLNFVKDPQNMNTILAQSSEFCITSKDDKTVDVSVDTPTTTSGGYFSDSSGAETASSSASSSNGALPNEFSNNGLAGLLVLLGAMLF